MKNFILITVLAVAGCVTGSHVITGKAHAPISPDTVKIYAIAPDNAEMIATLTATVADEGTGQRATDNLLKRIKKEAAAVGANGIVIGPQSATDMQALMNATAIYVP